MWSVGFKVLKVMTRKISVLLGVMCRLVDMCHSVGGTSHLHLWVPLVGGSNTSQNTSIS